MLIERLTASDRAGTGRDVAAPHGRVFVVGIRHDFLNARESFLRPL
jgi:hypothetical protein